ncbi:hypothetical protein WJX77_004502 [Trebouxia sp. C0004]
MQLSLSSTTEAHGAVGVGLINFAGSQELLQTIIDFRPRAIWLSLLYALEQMLLLARAAKRGVMGLA